MSRPQKSKFSLDLVFFLQEIGKSLVFLKEIFWLS